MQKSEYTQCTNCGDPIKFSEVTRLNSRGKRNRWPINPNGTDHRCFGFNKQGGKDAVVPKSVNEKGIKVKGIPCRYKCGRYYVRDESLQREPKIIEINSITGQATRIQHDYARCGYILSLQGKKVPFFYNGIDRQKITEQDIQNRLQKFDPEVQLYPADLFVLIGFDEKGQPIWHRNEHYHTNDGIFQRDLAIRKGSEKT